MAVQTDSGLFDIEPGGDTVLIRFTQSRLNAINMESVGRRLLRLAGVVGQRCLRLDFRNVNYLAGSGLGTILALNRKLQSNGGQLVVDNVPAQLYAMFEATRLTAILDVRRRETRTHV